MSRRNRGGRPQPQQQRKPAIGGPSGPGSPSGSPSIAPETAAEIAALEEKSITLALDEGLPEVRVPVPTGSLDLQKLARQAREAAGRFEAAREKYENRIADLKEREAALRTAEAEQAEKGEGLDEHKRELERRDGELTGRESDLKARELDALAGFVALAARQRAESLEALETEVERARELLEEYRRKLDDERRRADEEREAAVTEHRERLADLRRQLRAAETKATVEQERLEEDREIRALAAQEREAARLEALEGENRALSERLKVARDQATALDGQLRERDEAFRRLGHQSPDEVRRRIDTLDRENRDLRGQLAASVTAEERARLEDAARRLDESETERSRLMHEVIELRTRLERTQIAATEQETLRDVNNGLRARIDLMTLTLRELESEVDERIRRADGTSPFPQCHAMDTDPARQEPVRFDRRQLKLPDFIDDLRRRIAFDPLTGKRLYYEERDIRCFVAGMAMSRLHLLQGISGTGKTSLPQAVARALGAGSRLIAVQAGWRDRHDLIGHFNEFERRFYESEFLQALYEAQCPAYRDRPYVIVLDEMNLSHPEQYFADLLSALEQDRHLQQVELMTSSVHSAPKLLREGRILPLPENVWFVGTANHDETTMGFADKTYDRAHVMELPRQHPEPFPEESRPDRDPIALGALTGAFDAAREAHVRESDLAVKFLDENLGELLAERFGIGWGNRLERQIESFVPVVVAGDGTIGEALDHLVATKLLRRVRDRHDNRLDDLDRLRETLSAAWGQLKDGSTPERSLEVIDRERRRIEVG